MIFLKKHSGKLLWQRQHLSREETLNSRHWTDHNLPAGHSFQTRAGAELTGRECSLCTRA